MNEKQAQRTITLTEDQMLNVMLNMIGSGVMTLCIDAEIPIWMAHDRAGTLVEQMRADPAVRETLLAIARDPDNAAGTVLRVAPNS